MIKIKELRGALKDIWNENGLLLPDDKLIIKRKKKMMLVETKNGTKTKRCNVIKVEIIE